MIGKSYRFAVVISSVLLLGYAAFSPYSRAQEQGEEGTPSNQTLITIEVSVVRVELESLYEVMGETEPRSLIRVPLDTIWHCLREEEAGELVSRCQLLIGNGERGEITTEKSEQHQQKNHGASEHGQREIQMSFEAEADIIGIEGIQIQFRLKHLTREEGFAQVDEAEEEHAGEERIEVSTSLVLPSGQPRVVSVKSDGEVATFLIVAADM